MKYSGDIPEEIWRTAYEIAEAHHGKIRDTASLIADAIMTAVEVKGAETQKMILVPKTPTKGMIHAAAKALSPGRRPTQDWVSVNKKHAIRYSAMIEAWIEERENK